MGSRDDTEAIKECFTLYDRDNAGRIPCSRLGELVRSLGCHPTENDLSEYIRGTLRKDTFSLNDLVSCVARFRKNPEEQEEEIREAFRVFDRDSNEYVNAAELKHIMTTIGEKLTEAEVNEMIQEINVTNDGLIHYEEFVQLMMGK